MLITLVKSDAKAREKPCLRCGYSLRKIVDVRHCPECGLAVWVSLSGNSALEWSNPRWLGPLGPICAGIALLTLAAMGAYAAARFSPKSQTLIQQMITGFFLMIDAGLTWILTANEKRYPDRLKTYRIVTRILAVAAVTLGAWIVFAGLTEHNDDPLRFPPRLLALALSIATFAYLRQLARRMNSLLLSRLTGYLLLFPAGLTLVTWVILIYFLGRFIPVLVGFLPVIYLPATAILLSWYAVEFWRSAAAAQANWAKETGQGPNPA